MLSVPANTPPRAQHTIRFRQQQILEGPRRHVVQHRERQNSGERPVREGQHRRIRQDHLDTHTLQALAQGRREPGVYLDGGEAVGLSERRVGSEAWSRAQLQDVVTEYQPVECLRQQPVPDEPPPGR